MTYATSDPADKDNKAYEYDETALVTVDKNNRPLAHPYGRVVRVIKSDGSIEKAERRETDANGVITVTKTSTSNNKGSIFVTTGLGQLWSDLTYVQIAQDLVEEFIDSGEPDNIYGWIQMDIRELSSSEPTVKFRTDRLGMSEQEIINDWARHKASLPDIIKIKFSSLDRALRIKYKSDFSSETARSVYYNLFASLENTARRYGIDISDFVKYPEKELLSVKPGAIDKIRTHNIPSLALVDGEISLGEVGKIMSDQRAGQAYIYIPVEGLLQDSVVENGAADLRGKELIFTVRLPDSFMHMRPGGHIGLEAAAISSLYSAESIEKGRWIDVSRSTEATPYSNGFVFIIDDPIKRTGNPDNLITVRVRFGDEKLPFRMYDPTRITHVGLVFSEKNVSKQKFAGDVRITGISIRNAATEPNDITVEKVQNAPESKTQAASAVSTKLYKELDPNGKAYGDINAAMNKVTIPERLRVIPRVSLINAIFRTLDDSGRWNKAGALDPDSITNTLIGTDKLYLFVAKTLNINSVEKIDVKTAEVLMHWADKIYSKNMEGTYKDVAGLLYVKQALAVLKEQYSLKSINSESVNRALYLLQDLAEQVNGGQITKAEANHQAYTILVGAKKIQHGMSPFDEALKNRSTLWATYMVVAFMMAILWMFRSGRDAYRKTKVPITKVPVKKTPPKPQFTDSADGQTRYIRSIGTGKGGADEFFSAPRDPATNTVGPVSAQLESMGGTAIKEFQYSGNLKIQYIRSIGTGRNGSDEFFSAPYDAAKGKADYSKSTPLDSMRGKPAVRLRLTEMSASFASKFRLLGGGVVAKATEILNSRLPKKKSIAAQRIRAITKVIGIWHATDILLSVRGILDNSPQLLRGYLYENWLYVVLTIAIIVWIVAPLVRKLFLKVLRSGIATKDELSEAELQYRAMEVVLNGQGL
ncbi:MAG: hypothetical protein NTZ95_01890 [Candidatus Omnitrophica bacterium]|nr:hypothetical protein [Candidatus Omnitrophota bacterium]